MSPGNRMRAMKMPPKRFGKNVINERTLARAGNSCNAYKLADGNFDIDVFKVVLRSANNS